MKLNFEKDFWHPQALQIRATQNGKIVIDQSFGQPFRYFDVASLTKIMVTVPLIMMLYEKKAIRLDEKISHYLPFLKNNSSQNISISKLLSHNSGLIWWRPYFESLLRFPQSERKENLRRLLRKEKLYSTKKCVYSDPDFILLGFLIEELFGMPLEKAARKYLFQPLGLENTFFKSEMPTLKSVLFAPTEITKLRGKIQGTVHDDNAWSFGGVSAHAGLFSNLEDVSKFGNFLLNPLEYFNDKKVTSSILSPRLIRLFTKRAVTKNKGDWALGFAIPSRPTSTAGRLVSDHAFGHTGFTGTSLWIDVKRQATVTILSNRTFPTKKDERFLNLRREIHDMIWRQMGRSSK